MSLVRSPASLVSATSPLAIPNDLTQASDLEGSEKQRNATYRLHLALRSLITQSYHSRALVGDQSTVDCINIAIDVLAQLLAKLKDQSNNAVTVTSSPRSITAATNTTTETTSERTNKRARLASVPRELPGLPKWTVTVWLFDVARSLPEIKDGWTRFEKAQESNVKVDVDDYCASVACAIRDDRAAARDPYSRCMNDVFLAKILSRVNRHRGRKKRWSVSTFCKKCASPDRRHKEPNLTAINAVKRSIERGKLFLTAQSITCSPAMNLVLAYMINQVWRKLGMDVLRSICAEVTSAQRHEQTWAFVKQYDAAWSASATGFEKEQWKKDAALRSTLAMAIGHEGSDAELEQLFLPPEQEKEISEPQPQTQQLEQIGERPPCRQISQAIEDATSAPYEELDAFFNQFEHGEFSELDLTGMIDGY